MSVYTNPCLNWNIKSQSMSAHIIIMDGNRYDRGCEEAARHCVEITEFIYVTILKKIP